MHTHLCLWKGNNINTSSTNTTDRSSNSIHGTTDSSSTYNNSTRSVRVTLEAIILILVQI